MTCPGAIEVIGELAKSAGPEILIGAGTVLNADDARRCLDAGAQFLVSPGFNRATVELAVRDAKLIMAGALTPRKSSKHGPPAPTSSKSSRAVRPAAQSTSKR